MIRTLQGIPSSLALNLQALGILCQLPATQFLPSVELTPLILALAPSRSLFLLTGSFPSGLFHVLLCIIQDSTKCYLLRETLLTTASKSMSSFTFSSYLILCTALVTPDIIFYMHLFAHLFCLTHYNIRSAGQGLHLFYS